MAESDRTRKLRWLCRRGMKELDLLLETFLVGNQTALDAGAWPELETLLRAEDDQLWDWIQDPADPDAGAYRDVLDRIRGPHAAAD